MREGAVWITIALMSIVAVYFFVYAAITAEHRCQEDRGILINSHCYKAPEQMW